MADCNAPFRRWQSAVDELAKRHPVEVRRLDRSVAGAFDFAADVEVSILGPTVTALPGGTAGLPLLSIGEGKPSAAQTINGHSIALVVRLGNVRVFLTGDLTRVAGDALVAAHRAGTINLRSEVLKVPHHGSDDVSREFIAAVEPLASVISAGDEDARRDYLHPRANLLGLLGRANRGAEPVRGRWSLHNAPQVARRSAQCFWFHLLGIASSSRRIRRSASTASSGSA